MSRYVRDVNAAFTVVFESNAINTPIPGLADLLTSLDFVQVCVVGPDGTIESWLRGLAPSSDAVVETKLLGELKALAVSGRGLPVLSNLQRSSSGRPVFYLVKELTYRRLGLGILSTDYLVSLQQADRVWGSRTCRNHRCQGSSDRAPAEGLGGGLTGYLGGVRRSRHDAGQTGVGQFYSPAFNGDMIAGFAVVPETGWGVMVPQPLAELRRRAGQVAAMAIVIAGVTFAAVAFMSWLIAHYLARPLRQIAQTAEAVLAGGDDVSAPNFSEQVPREVRQLGLAFSTMLADLRRRNIETSIALRAA